MQKGAYNEKSEKKMNSISQTIVNYENMWTYLL